jgi:hypothetical protein
VGLLPKAANGPPIVIIQGSQKGCPVIVRKVNQLLVRELWREIQLCPQTHAPEELATPFERLRELDEKGRRARLGVNRVGAIENGIEQAEGSDPLASGLLGVSLGHFILKAPLAGVLGGLGTILDSHTVNIVRLRQP